MNIISQSVQKGNGKLKVMVKDTIDIQGLKTIAGSRALLEVEPAHDDAEVVKNILKADCEIIGKTNLHELAFGITGINHALVHLLTLNILNLFRAALQVVQPQQLQLNKLTLL